MLQAEKGRTEPFIDNLPGGPDVHQSCPKWVVLERFLVRSRGVLNGLYTHIKRL